VVRVGLECRDSRLLLTTKSFPGAEDFPDCHETEEGKLGVGQRKCVEGERKEKSRKASRRRQQLVLNVAWALLHYLFFPIISPTP
jgi:hypothetical protein